MTTATNERPIPTGEGLTFEKVWAMFQESDRQMKEVAARQKEEFDLECDRRKEEFDRQKEEIDRQMKETDRKIGELGNRFGELAEHLVAPGIAERFNALGYHFDAIIPGGYEIRDEQGKGIAEVDMLLENSDCIMAVEVKTRPRIQDIEHHVKRLDILRKYRNKHNDTRTIYGAIAGAVFGGPEKQATIDAGFYVIEQSGDTMRIDIPDNFAPKEW